MLDLYKHVNNSLQGLLTALRISISNADNFNTPGYKYNYASFTTILGETINPGSEYTNPQTIGGSMTLGSTTTEFTQGNLSLGTDLDLAILGEGFFTLSQSAVEFEGGAPKVFTRNGRFQVDFSNKYLTDAFGRKIYGYKLLKSGNLADTSLVPIETGGNTDIGFIDGGVLVSNYQARKDAIAAGDPNPPENEPLYRVALTSFQNKQGLIYGDGAVFNSTPASGEPLEYGIAGEGIYGNVLGERLESSNINVARVAMDMNLLNRGFSAIQGVIDDIGKILNGLISKLS
jgi:flagellar hook protein FlgE